MKNWIIIILVCVGIMACGSAYSQTRDLHFDHLTNEDGLSQSTIYSIYQDSDGFIWFATQGGLNKYDGYSFVTFKHDPTDQNSLSGNRVFSVCEDKIGNLWIATVKGLNKMNKRTGDFTRFKPDPNNPEALKTEITYSVYVDDEGFVWVKTASALNRLDTVSGKFTVFEHEIDLFSDFANTISNNFPIYEDENHNLWMGSAYGLFMFNRQYEMFESYQNIPGRNSIIDNYVTAIERDSRGNFWFGTGNGLSYYDVRKRVFTAFQHDDNDPFSISSNDVTSIVEDHLGNLWVGTRDAGLNYYNSKTKKFIAYKQDEENPNPYGLNNNEILSLYEDKSQILWIGLGAIGVDKLDMKRKKFELYMKSSGEHSIDLSHNVIASICKDDKGRLWIGTWYAGLNVYDRKTGEVSQYTAQSKGKNKIAGNAVHAVYKDSKNRMWVGTRNGVSVYENDEVGFRPLNYYFPDGMLPKFTNNRIYCIIEDRRNNIWIGAHLGLYRLNIETQTVKSYFAGTKNKDALNTISSNRVQSMTEDHEGYIWIGTDNGLNRFNPLDGRFKQYFNGDNPSNSLSNNSVFSVIEDSQYNLWIGTESGLNRFTWKDTSFTYYLKKDGLADDKIYEVLEDNSGNIWFSTDHGIIKLVPSTNEIRCYDRDDGLQGLEFNNGASHKAFDGELFFGGIRGFNSFYPDSMADNEIIPPIVLTTLVKTVGDKEETIYLQDKEEVVLSFREFPFTINFAALEFTKPEKNQYKYIMEGLNDNMVYIGTNNSITFSSLPNSEFVFRVVGSNNDLKWNEQGATLRISVTPPWWKSKWAYVIYVLLVGSIIYYFIEIRTRKLRRSNMILREKQLAALEIAKQKEELTIKNKNIMDSINYAKRIQEAMMPSIYLFKKLFPESFIMYLPKDVVSGDFYWISERNNKVFVAAVDCTGHGVPGAFMSIIGFDLLRNITEQGIEDPAEILNRLNDGVAGIFSKNTEEQVVKDGMDIALCIIDRTNMVIEFSGAFNPLYLARNNEIIEVKANRFSVGMMNREEDQVFECHTVPLQKDDVFYIFTDGYPDQFGGPLGKKFKYRRFRHLLLTIHSLPIDQQKAFLEENIDNWRGELEQVDDILIIGIKVT